MKWVVIDKISFITFDYIFKCLFGYFLSFLCFLLFFFKSCLISSSSLSEEEEEVLAFLLLLLDLGGDLEGLLVIFITDLFFSHAPFARTSSAINGCVSVVRVINMSLTFIGMDIPTASSKLAVPAPVA